MGGDSMGLMDSPFLLVVYISSYGSLVSNGLHGTLFIVLANKSSKH